MKSSIVYYIVICTITLNILSLLSAYKNKYLCRPLDDRLSTERPAKTLVILCGWWGWSEYFITKTCLYNFDSLKPHFYIVKLGFTGIYIIFHISAQNIDCGYFLEPPRRGGSNEHSQSMFCAEVWNISEFFLSENFHFWW